MLPSISELIKGIVLEGFRRIIKSEKTCGKLFFLTYMKYKIWRHFLQGSFWLCIFKIHLLPACKVPSSDILLTAYKKYPLAPVPSKRQPGFLRDTFCPCPLVPLCIGQEVFGAREACLPKAHSLILLILFQIHSTLGSW